MQGSGCARAHVDVEGSTLGCARGASQSVSARAGHRWWCWGWGHAMLCAAQSSSSPDAPSLRAGPQIGAGLGGTGISQPLEALRGRERGLRRGWGLLGEGGWRWCSCGSTWGQAGDKGEGVASTRGACCSGETEAPSCFPQRQPQGSAA